MDNAVLDACHRKGGGKNMQMVHDLRELFWLQVKGGFTVVTRWIGTKVNVIADGLTREQIAHDRRVTAAAVKLIFDTLGTPVVDWCASDANALRHPSTGERLPFVSQYMCPGSAGVDVLAQNLAALPGASGGSASPPILGYAFPPVPLLFAFVDHAKRCGARLIIVVERQHLRGCWYAAVQAHLLQTLVVGVTGDIRCLKQHTKDGRLVAASLSSDLLALLVDFSTAA